MLELLVILLPIVLADALNPVLAAAVIFALGTKQPYRGALWILLGWLIVYFFAGIGLALGLEKLTAFLANPRPVDFVIQLPIGLLLLWLAYKSIRGSAKPRRGADRLPEALPTTSHTLGFVAGFLLGATINLVGLPFALPYFAAIDQVLKADLDTAGALTVIALYNLAYVLPFAALAILRWIYRDQADELFQRINAWMEKASAVLMPFLLILIGAVLLADSLYYFTVGAPLINVG